MTIFRFLSPEEAQLFEGLLPFILLAGCFVVGGFTGKIAGDKGYSAALWFWAGFLFSIVGLIAAAGLPDKKLKSDLNFLVLKATSRHEPERDIFGSQPSTSPYLKKAASEK